MSTKKTNTKNDTKVTSTTVEPTPESVVEPVTEAVVEDSTVAVEPTPESVVEPVTETPDTVVELSPLEQYLNRYVIDMAPRVPLTEKLGAMNQYTLWKTIEGVLDNEDFNTFNEEWNLLLKYFLDYKDAAFSPIMVFRFAEYWEWSEDELKQLQNLINIIHLTFDPSTRAVGLKQVDFELAFNAGFNDRAKQNITQFYN